MPSAKWEKIIYRGLTKVAFPATKEYTALARCNGKYPDGVTKDVFRGGFRFQTLRMNPVLLQKNLKMYKSTPTINAKPQIPLHISLWLRPWA